MSKVYRNKLAGFPTVRNVSAYPEEKSTRGNEYASGKTQQMGGKIYPSVKSSGSSTYATSKSHGENFASYPKPKGKTPELAPASYASYKKGADDSGHKQSQGNKATIVTIGTKETVTIK
jgi:hypothetical protein